jgi:antitoxin component YwqK of YwqJK toxin-antitoxin module
MFDNVKKAGETLGASTMYYESGNVESILLDDRKTFAMGFYENGKMKSFTKYIMDSIKCGINKPFEETEWYENGQLKSKCIYNCGKQQCKEFYNDTTLGREVTIIDMELFYVGKYTEWHKNGKLQLKGQYKDGNTQSEANIKTGVWSYYNEKGILVKEEYYENNKLIKTNEYIKKKKATRIKG